MAIVLLLSACGGEDKDAAAGGGSEGVAASSDGGFRVDTTGCPPDVNEPIPDGEPITIGASVTLTGPLAGPQVTEGMQAYFNSVNAKGGIEGHQIEMTVLDDGNDPGRAQENLSKLVDQDGVFALFQMNVAALLGTEDFVTERCIPRLWVPSGLGEFGDPTGRPWTNSSYPSYEAETAIWAQYLAEEMPEGGTVGLVGIGGEIGEQFTRNLEENLGDGYELVSALFQPTAVTVDNEVNQVLASDPDIIFGATGGATCASVIQSIAAAGYDGPLVMGSNCAGVDAFFKPVGDAADGVIVGRAFKDPADPMFADDEAMKDYFALLAEYGPDADADNQFTALGYRIGVLWVDTLTRAAKMEGGLTRANTMTAAWRTDVAAPLGLEGVRVRTDGIEDAYGVEVAHFFVYNAAEGKFEPLDIEIDVEGSTGVFEG